MLKLPYNCATESEVPMEIASVSRVLIILTITNQMGLEWGDTHLRLGAKIVMLLPTTA